MGDHGVPDDVRALILEHIDSFAQLEALLCLHRQGEAGCDARALGRELRSNEAAAAADLAQLADRGLARQEPRARRYYYAPYSPQIDAAVRQLALAYREQRISISQLITLIYNKPSDKLQSFAAAFRLRTQDGKNDGGGDA